MLKSTKNLELGKSKRETEEDTSKGNILVICAVLMVSGPGHKGGTL